MNSNYKEILELSNQILNYTNADVNQRKQKQYKRRIFVHMRNYYLPSFIRGMTDTINNIWINANEYFRNLVLRHELLHIAHPEWDEKTVRQFHDSYQPYLPDVELVYV